MNNDRLRRIGPEGPEGAEKALQVGRVMLEKRKVVAGLPIGAQILHDAEISVMENFIENSLLLKLESFVLEEQFNHGVETVSFSKTKYIPIERDRILLALASTLVGAGLISYAFGAPVLVLLLCLVALGVAVLLSYLFSPTEKTVTVSGEVEFNVDSLIRFPENNRVFPPEFGRGYKAIEVQTYTTYDGEED